MKKFLIREKKPASFYPHLPPTPVEGPATRQKIDTLAPGMGGCAVIWPVFSGAFVCGGLILIG